MKTTAQRAPAAQHTRHMIECTDMDSMRQAAKACHLTIGKNARWRRWNSTCVRLVWHTDARGQIVALGGDK